MTDMMFKVGDKVISLTNVQGLVKGNVYDVVDVKEQPTPFGTIVTYVVQQGPTEEEIWVSNGHLILKNYYSEE